MPSSRETIKKELLALIADRLDEVSLLSDLDTFVEMEQDVIHCSANGQEFYFRVSLVPVNAEKND